MKTRFCSSAIIAIVLVISSCTKEHKPLCLHPRNSHYFLFREKPVVLIGSTEHYGAVMNLDFDYIKYLDELASFGLNITRTFSGIYVEPQGAFNIAKNTLAPGQGKFICPWARSSEPGYPGGGNKFDLTKWDPEYFARLKDFIAEAGKRNIVVELDLFSNFYDTVQWKLSPLYYSNNINGFKPVEDHREILSLRHPRLLKIQEEMVKKILEECNSFDNLYYEVCNEPYFGDKEALDTWEEHMTGIIDGIEKGLPEKHLISQNIENGSMKIVNPHPAVSIFNFHYAAPPVTVAMNYELNKPIGDNETGFRGTADAHYRKEGWDFMTAGGALYNNLDYSFTTENEDGSFRFPETQPGGGGKSLRNQLRILIEVFREIDFIRMKPVEYLQKAQLPKNASVKILEEAGKQYLIYINNTASEKTDSLSSGQTTSEGISLPINLPAGNYKYEWIDPVSGIRSPFEIKDHKGGIYIFSSDKIREDLALLIKG